MLSDEKKTSLNLICVQNIFKLKITIILTLIHKILITSKIVILLLSILLFSK